MENKGLYISSIIILCVALLGVVLFATLIGGNPIVSFIEDKIEGVSLHQAVAYASEGEYSNLFDEYYAEIYADVVPYTAVDKTVTWSVSWEDDTIQDDVDDYFDLVISQDTSLCKIVCLDVFKNKDAILTCTTNVGGFTATCRLTWVGNIKGLKENKSDTNLTTYFNESVRFGSPNFRTNYDVQYLDYDDIGYAYFDYQVGNACDYSDSRSLTFDTFYVSAYITYGIYSNSSHSFVNTNYSTDFIGYSNGSDQYSSSFNYHVPNNFSNYIESQIACLPWKADTRFNPSSEHDCIQVSCGWNPYLDENLWTNNGNNEVIRPYNVELYIFFFVKETNSNKVCSFVFKILFDDPDVRLTETSIQF